MQANTYTRRLIDISGADAKKFLQGMMTGDIAQLRDDALLFTAFLSPQGKMLYDGFLLARGETILLDIDAQHADACLTMLKRYKLRADVHFSDSALQLSLHTHHGLADPRHINLPKRHYANVRLDDAMADTSYHTIRLEHAIVEAAYDNVSDTAMDLGYDLLGAISFTKGCYVGQEVTARMKYKQIARKIPMRVAIPVPIESTATDIMAGTVSIGTLRSYIITDSTTTGVALIKLDSWHDANTSHTPITFASHLINLSVADWCEPRIKLWSQGQAAPLT